MSFKLQKKFRNAKSFAHNFCSRPLKKIWLDYIKEEISRIKRLGLKKNLCQTKKPCSKDWIKKHVFRHNFRLKSKQKNLLDYIKDYYSAVTLVQKLMKSDVRLNILVHLKSSTLAPSCGWTYFQKSARTRPKFFSGSV